MTEAVRGPVIYRFGPFLLNRCKRELIRDGQLLQLGSRAFEILSALVSRAGQILDKNELISAAWPDTVVEESNLRVHISGLRRALETEGAASRYIENVPGRGYCFVGTVEQLSELPSITESPFPLHQEPATEASLLISESVLVGRDAEMREISSLLKGSRCVTLTGPGGIGKTSLALAVASGLSESYPNGYCFVDFAQHTDERLVFHIICNALNIVTGESDPLKEMLQVLQDRAVLLVLDNCERFVAAIGEVVETLNRHASHIHLLVTSREPLRTSCEHIYPLEPLIKPPLCAALEPAQLWLYPAASLFLKRVQAIRPDLVVNPEQVPFIVRICNRLDGLPLALELAAARVPLFGFRELELRLDNRFSFLTKGRRTALPRHQTLAAMIRWSYETLTVQEARVWRSLGVFAGRFSLDAVLALQHDETYSEYEICDMMDGLVSKSLVSITWEQGDVSFYLLESMRYFARERLDELQETQWVQRLLVKHLLCVVRQPLQEWLSDAPLDWLQIRQHDMADVRAALTWAFGAGGDTLLGTQLAVDATPMFFRALQLTEIFGFHERIWQILPELELEADAEFSCRLCMALGQVWLHVEGASERVERLFLRGLAIANRKQLVREQLQLLWSLYAHAIFASDDTGVRRWTEQFLQLTAQGDDSYQAARVRTQMVCCHISGDFSRALMLGEVALKLDVQYSLQNPAFVYSYDHLVAAGAYHARTLWISGRQQAALALVHQTLARAVQLRQPFAFGHFIVCGLVPVALWSGDLSLACYGLDCLMKLTNGLAVNIWKEGGNLFRLVIAGLMDGQARVELQHTEISQFYLNVLATLDSCCLPKVVQARIHTMEPQAWCEAEVLRARGELMLREQPANAEGQALLREACYLACEQQATAWHLKAAISLARSGAPDGAAALDIALQQVMPEERAASFVQEAVMLLQQMQQAQSTERLPL